MKKITLILFIALFASCSKSEDSAGYERKEKPKKVYIVIEEVGNDYSDWSNVIEITQ